MSIAYDLFSCGIIETHGIIVFMKNVMIPIMVGLLIGGIVSGVYIWRVKGDARKTMQTQLPLSPTPTPVSLLTWNDQNGFSFQYPEGLTVNKHDEDKENYAHIEFTHPNHPGKLIVWGKDPVNGVADTGSWVKRDTRFVGANILDTEMGGLPAKKVMVTGNPQILVVGAVYDNIVWSVEATLEEPEYWTTIFTSITNSFTFVTVKSDVTASGSTSSDATVTSEDAPVDEEEVVE